MSPIRILAVPLLLAGCASTAPTASGPKSAPAPRTSAVVCAPGGDLTCFERASDLCRPKGYDLFDSEGRPATVADAQVRIVEARCKP
ncbi:hypothetical protein [Lysobacter sp. TY2-98]|uniref:hypothetical protein n=1 Tax=Lysobacter sp. TY2-98 TaxID=2290922 RepID=UPI0013B46C07|nr:hypothetical protein [Lysobacter sp. TY2-98]